MMIYGNTHNHKKDIHTIFTEFQLFLRFFARFVLTLPRTSMETDYEQDSESKECE